MKKFYVNTTHLTESTLVYTGKAIVTDLLIGMDGTNDPVVSVHDALNGNTSTNEKIPQATYDASALGMGGVTLNHAKIFNTGIYVKIASLGTGRVTIGWRKFDELPPDILV